MKKLTDSQWKKVEYNPINSMKKIGWYDEKNNRFQEVARWKNCYGTSGANYGILFIWNSLHNFIGYSMQGGRNTCGGYNKPIANMESCLYQYEKAIKNNEIVSEKLEKSFSNCGSIDSLTIELKDYLQKYFNKKLFIIDIL